MMDPKVLAHYDGDVTLANIHPPLRFDSGLTDAATEIAPETR